MKNNAPQFELPGVESAFNLAGEAGIDAERIERNAATRTDETLPLFSDAETNLRDILTRKGVPASKQNEIIADATAKAQPGYMDRFFPALVNRREVESGRAIIAAEMAVES